MWREEGSDIYLNALQTNINSQIDSLNPMGDFIESAKNFVYKQNLIKICSAWLIKNIYQLLKHFDIGPKYDIQNCRYQNWKSWESFRFANVHACLAISFSFINWSIIIIEILEYVKFRITGMYISNQKTFQPHSELYSTMLRIYFKLEKWRW